MIRYVGLDVHKRLIVCCVLNAAGEVLLRTKIEHFDDLALGRWLGELLLPEDQVALEVTTNAKAICRLIKPMVQSVTMSNPLATKAIAAAKVKTDKVDAFMLAQLLRLGYLPGVWQPDEPTDRRRELVNRRASLVRQRIGIKNRLHSLLAVRLLVPPVDLFSKAGRAWLETVELDAPSAACPRGASGLGRKLADSDLLLLEVISEQIELIDGELIREAYGDEQVKLLMTLPGVDVAIAVTLIAAWGDVRRFRDAKSAAAYLGLVPSTRQSADKCYHGKITKRGSKLTRWMLVQAAQRLDRHPGPLGYFFKRLAKRKHRNVAVVASARKLACIAWHMLTTGQPYRYALPKPTEHKLSRLRVKATGERRKTGPTKGTKVAPKLGTGTKSRTIRALAEVYAVEGVPPLAPAPAGEERALERAGCARFARSLQRSKVVPKKAPAQCLSAGKHATVANSAKRATKTARPPKKQAR